jgi:NADH-quinone oxidoreductase subunit E
MESFNEAALKPLLDAYQKDTGSLVTLLQEVQAALGYLPREALQHIGRSLDIPVSRLFCIATFYNAFSLEPRGRHTVSVCLGTACHVKGGENLAAMLSRQLDLSTGEGTAADRSVTLKKVRCLGCCSMAPVVKVNENIHGYMTQTKTAGLLSTYRKDAR